MNLRSRTPGGSTPVLAALAVALTAGAGSLARSEDKPPRPRSPEVDQAIRLGVCALTSAQATRGCYGEVTGYPVAITAMAGLAVLAANADALHDRVVLRAHAYLREAQREGSWQPEASGTWMHCQGFATLFYAELYGRVLLARGDVPGELDKAELRATTEKAVARLARAQCESGGWGYFPQAGTDEGSTTVCVVQALRAARNFGIAVEPRVLERGFAYLKRTQNPDGGFRYTSEGGASMRAGTAADVATLVLMQKLDEKVLFSALDFLKLCTVGGIANGSSGQYATFYAAMAMKVLGDEYGDHLPLAAEWSRGLEANLLALRNLDGTWTDRDFGGESRSGYATALAVLSLACPEGRLSIFHRRAPKLPEDGP